MTTNQVRSISATQAAALSAEAQGALASNANYVPSNTSKLWPLL